MKDKSYRVMLQINDKTAFDFAMKTLMDMNFNKLCVVESGQGMPFNPSLFDMAVSDNQDLKSDCVGRYTFKSGTKSGRCVFVHISDTGIKKTTRRGIEIHRKFFEEYFHGIVILCYLSRVMKSKMREQSRILRDSSQNE